MDNNAPRHQDSDHQPGTGDSIATWSIWRQDDNGNRARISGGHSRETAERLCREFEAKGHKQTYWVDRDGRG